jgi:hypothetical protein
MAKTRNKIKYDDRNVNDRNDAMRLSTSPKEMKVVPPDPQHVVLEQR